MYLSNKTDPFVKCFVRGGLDFESLDGRPAQIVVMILVPKHEKLIHLQTLTEVARRLGDASFRTDLLAAASPEAVIQLWS